MTPEKLFAAISFIFVSVLLIVVFHEVLTGNLPSDNREKLENISHQYGPDFVQEAKGNIIGENEEFLNEETRRQDYQFVKCPGDDKIYPEGTECFDDAEEQDDYNYEENDKGKTVVKEDKKEKDRDEDDEDEDKDNKYSIQVCPPKCGRDDDDKDDDPYPKNYYDNGYLKDDEDEDD